MERYTLTDHQAYVEAEEKRKAAGELCHDLPFRSHHLPLVTRLTALDCPQMSAEPRCRGRMLLV